MKLEDLYKLLLEAEANHKIISERKEKEKRNRSSEETQNEEKEVEFIPIDLFSETEITETPETIEIEEVDDKTDTSRLEIEVIKDYELPPLNLQFSTAKGAKAKRFRKFAQILRFIDVVNKKGKVAPEGCTILPIPIDASAYKAIWGSRENVQNGNKLMEEINLISLHKQHDHKNHIAKTFKYYKENEALFIKFCEENGITKSGLIEEEIKPLENWEKQLLTFDPKEVIFSYDRHIVKPEGISKSVFIVEQILPCLYENYPWFNLWRRKIKDEINPFLRQFDTDLELKLEPKITWTTVKYKKTGIKKVYIRKIGIRIANTLVRLSDKKDNEKTKYLNKMGFNLDKDVKSSIPRITKSLHNLRWIDESEDIYKLINDYFEPGSEFNNERRDAIKNLHMRIYFDNKSDQNIVKNIMKYLRDNEVDISGINKKELTDLVSRYRQAMIKAEDGEPLGNEAFYVESMVYLLTIYDLIKSGKPVFFVFDCFYSKGPESKEDFGEAIKSSIKVNFEYFLSDFLGVKKEEVNSNKKVIDVINRLKEKYNIE